MNADFVVLENISSQKAMWKHLTQAYLLSCENLP